MAHHFDSPLDVHDLTGIGVGGVVGFLAAVLMLLVRWLIG